jgi:hypothetical protein
LRQGIKLSGIHAAWNNKVSCTFRGRLDEERGFNVHKTILVQVVSGRSVYGIPEFQVLSQLIAAQIKISELHAQVVPTISVVLYSKGWSVGLIEYCKFSNDNLNFACRDVVIFITSFLDRSSNLDDKFSAERDLVQLIVELFTNYQLGDSIPVAQVDECYASEFSNGLYPSGKGHFLAGIHQS